MLARGLLLFAVTIWGWTFVATKICLQYISPVEVMGLRLFIALPILFAVLLVRGIRIDVRRNLGLLTLASTIIGLHFIIQISGLKYTSATNTGWIIAVTPLVMALLAAVFLKEPLHRTLVAGIGIATAGIVLLVSRGSVGGLGWLGSIGDWLVLISAHTWALYTIATRNLIRTENAMAVVFAVMLPPAIVALGFMLATSDWGQLARLPTDAWLALLFLGIFGMALAQWFWQVGVSRLGAARAGVFLYVEPLAATALAVPYLGESFGVYSLIGGSLVLLGVWIAQRPRPAGGPDPA